MNSDRISTAASTSLCSMSKRIRRNDPININFITKKTTNYVNVQKNGLLVLSLLLILLNSSVSSFTSPTFTSNNYYTTFTQQSTVVQQQQKQQRPVYTNQFTLFAASKSNSMKKKNKNIMSSIPSVQSITNSIRIIDPFASLPWNVRRTKELEYKRIQIERSILHRQLGIVEDATFEEIVEATNTLLEKAGNNLKEKIKIEVTKDKILQMRLNERLAGLTIKNQEARAMSTYETDGIDDDEDFIGKKKGSDEWVAPKWTQGLIVRPDEAHIKSQLRLWGILTAVGLALPPAQDYLGRFTWLVCVAQLTFRGMPKESREGGGGMGMSFNMGSGGGGHRKVAFALGFTTWIIGAIIAYGMMPKWAKGQRWTASAAFTIQNTIFAFVSCYVQPYKGGK